MKFGSLFAGIGGMDLGLERAGMSCAWQVEIDDYANRVLEKHWPSVRRHDDVRTFPPTAPEEWAVDLIAGGFPCQDISRGGNQTARRGLEGERSGLWFEFARCVQLLRPRFVLVENVPDILHRGIGTVLGNLARMGYDAEWGCLSASMFGAPQPRKRLFLVAYSGSKRTQRIFTGQILRVEEFSWCKNVRGPAEFCRRPGIPQPVVRRSGDGIPSGVDRLRCLGNAVVPQVAEWIGRRIMEQFQVSG